MALSEEKAFYLGTHYSDAATPADAFKGTADNGPEIRSVAIPTAMTYIECSTICAPGREMQEEDN
jgi:hypothetical protein